MLTSGRAHPVARGEMGSGERLAGGTLDEFHGGGGPGIHLDHVHVAALKLHIGVNPLGVDNAVAVCAGRLWRKRSAWMNANRCIRGLKTR